MPDVDKEPKSKSQKKREHLALQSLAEALIRLSAGELATIPMSTGLRQNVIDAATMKKGAFRRQVRYLAKLLSEENVEEILALVERAGRIGREETARLHRIERWRERLVENAPGAVDEFFAEHPDANRQQFRQLIRAARKERERNAPPRAFRRLFEQIRDLET